MHMKNPILSLVSQRCILPTVPTRHRYDLDGYFTPKNGVMYAHTGVMGYGRLRWVDMDAYEAAAATTRSSSDGASDDASVVSKLAQLLIDLDLTPSQMQHLQAGLGKSGLLDRK